MVLCSYLIKHFYDFVAINNGLHGLFSTNDRFLSFKTYTIESEGSKLVMHSSVEREYDLHASYRTVCLSLFLSFFFYVHSGGALRYDICLL
jgi:hypothetical protein